MSSDFEKTHKLMTGKTRQGLGDAPITEPFRESMNFIAGVLDEAFNGTKKGKNKDVGFVLLTFPYGNSDERVNFISNGADREDIKALFWEMTQRFEKQKMEQSGPWPDKDGWSPVGLGTPLNVVLEVRELNSLQARYAVGTLPTMYGNIEWSVTNRFGFKIDKSEVIKPAWWRTHNTGLKEDAALKQST